METSLSLELIQESLNFVQAELALSVGILVLIIASLLTKRFQIIKTIALVISILNAAILITDTPTSQPLPLFHGMLTLDEFNFKLRILIALTGLLIVVISQAHSILKYHAEYFTLALTITLGGQLLVMSNHMAMVIISLELMSIPAYVLAGFAFTKESAEAGMKYFVYGAAATAFMIFGLSWLYGLGQSLELRSPTFIDMLGYNNNIVLFTACLFVMVGLLFKMAAAPFHLWAPDVYEAAPLPALALFSTVPKIAAGAVLFKAIDWFSLHGQSKYDWITVPSALAILTLAVGNFSALWQKNIKRLMAYSSIGQAGFLVAATINQGASGLGYFYFYAAVLAISTILVFTMLAHFERSHKAFQVGEFAGLGRNNSLPAILLTVGLLSLTGLPITAGFTAKLFVFTGILEVWQGTGKPIVMILFVFGLLNTVVALYYYLQLPYQMFLKENHHAKTVKATWIELCVGSILALALIALFTWPAVLLNG